MKLQNPTVPFSINQKFGNPSPVYTNLGLLGHNGLDLFAYDGVPVFSAHDGVVTYAGEDGSGGQTIVIRSFETLDGNLFKTVYCHMKKGTFVVTSGDTVKAGQKIAFADNTGLSTGSHLHFGLKPIKQGEQEWVWDNIEQNNGYRGAVDPLPYIEVTKKLEPCYLGQVGDNVACLQGSLKRWGFFNHDVTGFYGDITRKAVFDFQKAYVKLSLFERTIMRGSHVGPKTLLALEELNNKL